MSAINSRRSYRSSRGFSVRFRPISDISERFCSWVLSLSWLSFVNTSLAAETAEQISALHRPMQAKPEYYRAQAERCRNLATSVLDWDLKQTLLDVADEYAKLANEAERRRR